MVMDAQIVQENGSTFLEFTARSQEGIDDGRSQTPARAITWFQSVGATFLDDQAAVDAWDGSTALHIYRAGFHADVGWGSAILDDTDPSGYVFLIVNYRRLEPLSGPDFLQEAKDYITGLGLTYDNRDWDGTTKTNVDRYDG